jgi:hypothetical protein
LFCRNIFLIFIFLFCFRGFAVAQDDESSDDHKNHLFLVQYGFSSSLIGKTFGANGGVATLGFNPAKFFSDNLTFGPVVDLKILPGFVTFHPGKSFMNDFNSDFVSPSGGGLDSANAEVVRVNMNARGKNSYGIKGNTMFYYGLMFSVFPDKYGAILLQVKRGTVGYNAHQLIFENQSIPDIAGYDKFPFSISKSWKYEITFRPQAFREDSYIDVYNPERGDFWKMFSFSVFYERVNFKTAEFNGTKFSQFMTDAFMKKYAFDNRFGFKIGFSFY